jgi:hypothetical protein
MQRTAWSGVAADSGQRLAAAVDGVTAAGHEGAAARPLADADRHAGDAAQRARPAEVGDGRHQRPRVGVAGPLDHLVGRAALDHAAGVHDDDPIGHLRHHRQVVGDIHHRHAVVVAQASQLGQDPVLGDHVEPGGGLVQHRHRRSQTQAIAIVTRCCWPPDSWWG